MSDLLDRLQDMVDFKHDDMDVAREAIEEITHLRAKVDAVYSERNRLAAAFARMALAAGFKAGKGVDSDETKWPVVYVDTPNGQVSWHIAEVDARVLEGLPQYSEQWDGTFRARDATWPTWPITDLVATARREGMEEAARIAEGEIYNERYRTWPWWEDRPGYGRGNVSEDSQLVLHCDAIAVIIRAAAKEGK